MKHYRRSNEPLPTGKSFDQVVEDGSPVETFVIWPNRSLGPVGVVALLAAAAEVLATAVQAIAPGANTDRLYPCIPVRAGFQRGGGTASTPVSNAREADADPSR